MFKSHPPARTPPPCCSTPHPSIHLSPQPRSSSIDLPPLPYAHQAATLRHCQTGYRTPWISIYRTPSYIFLSQSPLTFQIDSSTSNGHPPTSLSPPFSFLSYSPTLSPLQCHDSLTGTLPPTASPAGKLVDHLYHCLTTLSHTPPFSKPPPSSP